MVTWCRNLYYHRRKGRDETSQNNVQCCLAPSLRGATPGPLHHAAARAMHAFPCRSRCKNIGVWVSTIHPARSCTIYTPTPPFWWKGWKWEMQLIPNLAKSKKSIALPAAKGGGVAMETLRGCSSACAWVRVGSGPRKDSESAVRGGVAVWVQRRI